MKPIENWDLIDEAGEFKPLPPMIVGVRITKVVDKADAEYFEIYCDITKGEYKDHFKKMVEAGQKDLSKTIRSYKANALPFFKAFITAVEKSNPGYKWDWDEQKLVGKGVIAVFGQEEYKDTDGNIKISTKIQEFRSLEAFNEGRIKLPELKKLPPEPVTGTGTDTGPGPGNFVPQGAPVVDPNDLPF